MSWPFWIMGAVVGTASGMVVDAFELSAWQAIILVVANCTAIAMGATRVDAGGTDGYG